MQKVVFSFPSLTHFFIAATYWRFSTGPEQASWKSAQVCLCQNLFSILNKGSNNPAWVGKHAKKI